MDNPLPLSVRWGGDFSMPGMMETILDIGLGDASVLGLAKATGSERFAWDSYRRLLQMYSHTVLGIAEVAGGARRPRPARRGLSR